MCVCLFSIKCLRVSHSVTSDSFVTPWTVACQVPLFMGLPRQEYWSRLPFPSPGDHSQSGIEPISCLADGFFITEPPEKPMKKLTAVSIFPQHYSNVSSRLCFFPYTCTPRSSFLMLARSQPLLIS